MSYAHQDPATASAPFDSVANGSAVRTLAQDEPRTIEVVAKRFAFEPAHRRGDAKANASGWWSNPPMASTAFEIKKFKVEKIIPRGKPVTIEFVARAAGEYPILCSENCGDGHEDMKGMLSVTVKKR